jgi:hypothetical protein
VKTSSGRMDHTDLILASSVMNAILDRCFRSSQEEREEILVLPVLLRDLKSRNLLLIIITEFETKCQAKERVLAKTAGR